jgi:hypothetical protein
MKATTTPGRLRHSKSHRDGQKRLPFIALRWCDADMIDERGKVTMRRRMGVWSRLTPPTTADRFAPAA